MFHDTIHTFKNNFTTVFLVFGKYFFFQKNNFKTKSTVLFTHLKIILLQCFQFSAISGIQTDPKQET